MSDDGRLDDEQLVPETLDSLGAKIANLGRQVDKRFEQVDNRLDEVKSSLGAQIEALSDTVQHAVERLDDVLRKDVGNSAAHARMEMRLENHELRILALEKRPGPSS